MKISRITKRKNSSDNPSCHCFCCNNERARPEPVSNLRLHFGGFFPLMAYAGVDEVEMGVAVQLTQAAAHLEQLL